MDERSRAFLRSLELDSPAVAEAAAALQEQMAAMTGAISMPVCVREGWVRTHAQRIHARKRQ
jgi:hypothetical protein